MAASKPRSSALDSLQSRLDRLESRLASRTGGAQPAPLPGTGHPPTYSSTTYEAPKQSTIVTAAGNGLAVSDYRPSSRNSDVANRKSSIDSASNSLQNEITRLHVLLEDKIEKEKVARQELQNEQLAKESVERKLKNVTADLETLRRENERLRSMAVESGSSTAGANRESLERVERAEAELARLKQSKAGVELTLRERERELHTLKAHLAEAQQNSGSFDEALRLQHQNQDLHAQLKAMKQDWEVQKSELSAKAEEVETLQRYRTVAESQRRELENKAQDLERILQGDSGGSTDASKKELASFKKKIVAALGEDLDPEESTDTLIEHLLTALRKRRTADSPLDDNEKDRVIVRLEHEIRAMRTQTQSSETAGKAPENSATSLAELKELRDLNEQLQLRLVEMTNEKAELRQSLDAEQHINNQLSQETETIGDYIQLYHEERARLSDTIRERDIMIKELESARDHLLRKLNAYATTHGKAPAIADAVGDTRTANPGMGPTKTEGDTTKETSLEDGGHLHAYPVDVEFRPCPECKGHLWRI
eukprot:Clim_evm32s33 gene=Clim_evmTU32s33